MAELVLAEAAWRDSGDMQLKSLSASVALQRGAYALALQRADVILRQDAQNEAGLEVRRDAIAKLTELAQRHSKDEAGSDPKSESEARAPEGTQRRQPSP